MQQPEAYIGNAADLLGAGGKVTDKKAGETMAAFMTAFGEWIDMTTSPGDASFASFMQEREASSVSYVNGDDGPLQAMATKVDPATFFPPSGDRVSGAAKVSKAHYEGTKAFQAGSTGSFDVLQSGSSGKLAFWTGVQHAEAMLKGKDGPTPMRLRTTEVFRYEDGGWKLAHRHADMIGDKD